MLAAPIAFAIIALRWSMARDAITPLSCRPIIVAGRSVCLAVAENQLPLAATDRDRASITLMPVWRNGDRLAIGDSGPAARWGDARRRRAGPSKACRGRRDPSEGRPTARPSRGRGAQRQPAEISGLFEQNAAARSVRADGDACRSVSEAHEFVELHVGKVAP